MRFRLGLVVGAAVGYYYGAKAGRQRYEQIERWLRPIRRSGPYAAATEKARGALGGGLRKSKDALRGAAFDTDQSTVDLRGDDA